MICIQSSFSLCPAGTVEPTEGPEETEEPEELDHEGTVVSDFSKQVFVNLTSVSHYVHSCVVVVLAS